MRKVNYKSDFDFILRLHDCKGEETGWPEYDWRARFWTASRMSAYEASCIGGVCRNCRNDNGQIRIYCDDHGLSAGDLQMEFTAILPADEYPDSDRRVVVPSELDIRLVRDAAPCPRGFSADLSLPYMKGDKGEKGDKGDPMRWEDMTEEERDALTDDVAEKVAGKVADSLPGIAGGDSALTPEELESLFDGTEDKKDN